MGAVSPVHPKAKQNITPNNNVTIERISVSPRKCGASTTPEVKNRSGLVLSLTGSFVPVNRWLPENIHDSKLPFRIGRLIQCARQDHAAIREESGLSHS